jgi:hypothetical protein
MKKKKGLQKLSDFEKIETPEQFLSFIESNPEKLPKYKDYLFDKLNAILRSEVKEEGDIDRYFNRLIKIHEDEKDEVGVKSLRRDRWYVNESHINTYINNELMRTRIVPSVTSIAAATGISRTTVQKHIREGKDSEYYSEQRETLRGLTHSVLSHLFRIGIAGDNVKALKVFLDYFKESPALQQGGTHINTQNNYIQINGVTISQEQITKLAPEQLIQIEQVLKLSKSAC